MLVFAGALISHEKLLLQINPERELGSVSYKLGQVSLAPHQAPAHFCLQTSVLNTPRRKAQCTL